MWVSALITLVVALLYNVLLVVHLYKEKISNVLNEDYVIKKEIEYVVGISEMWLTRYFFLFSSFTSDIFKMYHRPIFNTFALLLVIVHGALGEGTPKIGIILGLFTVFTAYIIGTRPYRCMFSNILLFLLSAIMLVNTFVFLLKKTGMKSALFVDNYFYGLLILINAFGWFLVAVFMMFLVAIKRKWPVDKETIAKAVAG